MLITETTPRADLELAALELGLANTADQCAALLAMSDRELYDTIVAFIAANNEAAPF